MRRVPAFVVVASLLFLVPALGQDGEPAGGQAEKRGMVPEDYYRFQFVSDPQISPDGTQIAFVVATVSEDRRTRESSIWMVAADGSSEPHKYTGGTSDRSPRWSPDGIQLAFSRNLDGRSQIHVIPLVGGEAAPIGDLDKSVSSFQWSPDGEAMILSIRSDPEEDEKKVGEGDMEATAGGGSGEGEAGEGASEGEAADAGDETEEEKPKADVKVITWARYKANGAGYLDERRSHLWHLDIESGELNQLTSGADWNDGGASISPDGTRIAFSSNRTGEDQFYTLNFADGTMVQLTDDKDVHTGCLDAANRIVYYFAGHVLKSVRLDDLTEEEHMAVPAAFIPASLSCTADGRYLAFTMVELAQTELCTARFEAEFSGGSKGFREKFFRYPSSVIIRYDTQTHTGYPVTGELRRMTHVIIHPTDGDTVLYCHEGPWDLVQRMWIANVATDETHPLVETQRHLERVGHEFFTASGRVGTQYSYRYRADVDWLFHADIYVNPDGSDER